MTSPSQDRSFLDSILADLMARGVNVKVTLEPSIQEILTETPEMTRVLMGYFTTAVPVLDEDPASFVKAGECLGMIQQRLDYASYQYERIHPLYNAIKEQQQNIRHFAILNLDELRSLKTVDLRDAAISYLTKDHLRFLTKLDEVYSLIASVKENLKNAHFSLKLQMDLINCKNTRYHGAGQLASAPGSAGVGRTGSQ
ncbi:hypothetical protein [Ewingella americana]|uniref:Uncharacterized protein n=1 Tax=Ewingella americana TaxID=41202 RepID=A0A502GEV7_9GAMM|nr:hypothetical protein [Ewingella americana]TPG60068.1 hypothetical protein EAH77_15995 [Ewingella americana]